MYYVSYAVAAKKQFRRDMFNGDHWDYQDALIDQHPLLWLTALRAEQVDNQIRILFWNRVLEDLGGDVERLAGLTGAT